MINDNVSETNIETRKLPLLTKGREVEVSQKRSFTIDRAAVDASARTCSLSFSSETPVERWYGNEILSHAPGACDLSRLNAGGPLLTNHDREKQCGVVDTATIEGGKGRAVVRFSKSEDGEEIMQDVVDGIRRNVSVSYEVREMVLQSEKDGVETYLITRWAPLEISLVSIPADQTVGVGRSHNQPTKQIMDPENKTPEKAAAPVIEIGAERKRNNEEIKAICNEHHLDPNEAMTFMVEGRSVEEYRKVVVEHYRNRPAPKMQPSVGLNDKEAKSFSMLRALRALSNPNDARAKADAAFEFEVSEAAQKAYNRSAQGILIPLEVLTAKRDLTVGTPADGGFLKGTQHLGGEFIDVLRNRMVVRQAGARVLSGLRGDIDIPKRTTGVTSYWVSENNAPTEGTNVYTQVTMAPNTVGAFVDISRRLMLQSDPSVEGLIREDIALSLAIAIDKAALHGAGTDEPLGLAGTSGIGAVAIGTNGGYIAWEHIIAMETGVYVANADTNTLCYITNPKVRGILKTTLDNQSAGARYIWQPGGQAGEGMVNGYRALTTNQVSSVLTKGTGTALSGVFFGDFSQIIIGEWGALDLMVDPYTGSAAGTTRVRALQDVDVAVRLPQSFSYIADAQTA